MDTLIIIGVIAFVVGVIILAKKINSKVPHQATSTVYTSGSWTIGTMVYSDAALTTAVTGYNYVVNVADGIIYEINVSTGEIQFDSGLTC